MSKSKLRYLNLKKGVVIYKEIELLKHKLYKFGVSFWAGYLSWSNYKNFDNSNFFFSEIDSSVFITFIKKPVNIYAWRNVTKNSWNNILEIYLVLKLKMKIIFNRIYKKERFRMFFYPYKQKDLKLCRKKLTALFTKN